MSLIKTAANWLLKDELTEQKKAVEYLKEAVDELERDNIGWQKIGEDDKELSIDELKKIHQLAYIYWLKNPIAGQIVNLKTFFTIGAGIAFTAEDDEVQRELKKFWNDPDNKMFLRQTQMSDELEIYSELFIRFFVNEINGDTKIWLIDPTEITDIIPDPDNPCKVLYFKREWTEKKFNDLTKQYDSIEHKGSDADYIPGDEIFHVAINNSSNSKRGISKLYRVIPWIKAYTAWLEDRIALNKARGAFAWKKKVKNIGAKLMQQMKESTEKAINTLMRRDAVAPPRTGSVLVENEGTEWSVISPDIKADSAFQDGRAIKLMICAGSNIFEHYFGDAKQANLASAQAMELPMLKEFQWRQELFRWILSQIFKRVIKSKIECGVLNEKTTISTRKVDDNGKIIEDEKQINTIDCYIDIDLPTLTIKDIKEYSEAMAKQMAMKVRSRQSAAQMLGVSDWEQERVLILEEELEETKKSQKKTNELKENAFYSYPPFPNIKGGE